MMATVLSISEKMEGAPDSHHYEQVALYTRELVNFLTKKYLTEKGGIELRVV